MRTLVLAMALITAPFCAAHGQEPPFVPGRPGATESPISVPPGYLQIETEIVSYARDERDGVEASTTAFAATAFRYGLAPGWDGELIVQPYISQLSEGAGVEDDVSGFGDVSLRVRRTLMGQSGEGPALAVIGFVTLPTSADDLGDDEVQGGALITGAVALGPAFGLTGTLGIASVGDDDGREAEFSGGVNLSYAATERVAVYGEVFGAKAARDREAAATLNLGFTYLVAETTQLDAGANIGLTNAAEDATLFIGWARRF